METINKFAPEATLDAAPDVAPEAAPDAVPEATLDAAPDVAPEAAPDAAQEAAQGPFHSDETPSATLGETPRPFHSDETPSATLGETPGPLHSGETPGPLPISATPNRIMPMIALILVIAGPVILYLGGRSFEFKYSIVKIEYSLLAKIVPWIAMVLPGAGFFIGAVSLRQWKNTGKTSRALAIVALAMSNPFFYITFIAMCLYSRMRLAGLVSM